MVLDIDDTLDVVHGRQKLAEWSAHYDERCFLPIHIYDTATGRPVTMILRPGKTPSGGQLLPMGMGFSVFTASGRFASVTLRTPLSKAAVTLSGSMVSPSRNDLWKLP